mmetsp:Transcript_1587/g.5079  ORF Transcript_1587/g.5079 Transcript_1587/m.5079 type:complete len:230 (+) Transcript_1587:1389-2078(+)
MDSVTPCAKMDRRLDLFAVSTVSTWPSRYVGDIDAQWAKSPSGGKESDDESESKSECNAGWEEGDEEEEDDDDEDDDDDDDDDCDDGGGGEEEDDDEWRLVGWCEPAFAGSLALPVLSLPRDLLVATFASRSRRRVRERWRRDDARRSSASCAPAHTRCRSRCPSSSRSRSPSSLYSSSRNAHPSSANVKIAAAPDNPLTPSPTPSPTVPRSSPDLPTALGITPGEAVV